MADALADRVDALIEKGEDIGCVNLSELSEAIQDLELDEEQIAPSTSGSSHAGSRSRTTAAATASSRRR